VNHPGKPSWERLVFWLIAVVIGLELLASVIPRLFVPLVVLAAVVAVLRLVWFFTGRY
jgi:hypothetical protein